MNYNIGCSGFYYTDWKKKFYPDGLSQKDWLPFYAEHFNTVEINNTFYRMPVEKNLLSWKNKTPADFKFTIKANRFFTHDKKLIVDEEFNRQIQILNNTLNVLDDKLGCILWQIPGSIHNNLTVLRHWCDTVDKSKQNVIEFRHTSWFTDDVYEMLHNYKIAFCMISAPGNLPEATVATAPTAYLRMHGKQKWYRYFYSDDELHEWEKRIKSLTGVENMYVYFNNDYDANAVKNAKKLSDLLK